jgi:hypothetical protein
MITTNVPPTRPNGEKAADLGPGKTPSALPELTFDQVLALKRLELERDRIRQEHERWQQSFALNQLETMRAFGVASLAELYAPLVGGTSPGE